jgi:hypothetical protein
MFLSPFFLMVEEGRGDEGLNIYSTRNTEYVVCVKLIYPVWVMVGGGNVFKCLYSTIVVTCCVPFSVHWVIQFNH